MNEAPSAARPLTRNRVAGIVLALIALAIAWEAHKLPLGSLRNPGAGFLPLALAAALALVAILVAVLDRGTPAWRSVTWPELPRAAAILAVTAFGAFGLERLGYRITTFLMAAALLLVLERKHPVPALIAALVLSAGTHFLFATLLKVPLPPGPWGL